MDRGEGTVTRGSRAFQWRKPLIILVVACLVALTVKQCAVDGAASPGWFQGVFSGRLAVGF